MYKCNTTQCPLTLPLCYGRHQLDERQRRFRYHNYTSCLPSKQPHGRGCFLRSVIRTSKPPRSHSHLVQQHSGRRCRVAIATVDDGHAKHSR